MRFRTWDLGGHQQVRNLWSDHYFKADAVVFVVDTNDRERFEEAQKVSSFREWALSCLPWALLRSHRTERLPG